MSALPRLLLVDDEADIRRIAELALRRIGKFDVTVAASGPKALEVAAALSPDVILLDVMMPGMDGPTALARLREIRETAGTPVIFLTAKVQRREIEGLVALGAIGVIAKPFDPMTLADQVRALMDGRGGVPPGGPRG